jgi:hypothetical protein
LFGAWAEAGCVDVTLHELLFGRYLQMVKEKNQLHVAERPLVKK